MQWDGGVDGAVEEAEVLQPAQGLGEDLGADALEPALELSEPLRPLLQGADGQGGPLVGEQVE